MRKIAVPPLVGLILAAGALAQEEGRPPLLEKARLTAGSVRYKVRWGYALPDGVVAVEKPKVRKTRIGKRVFLFFDIDGNGKFNDRGVDAWALAKMPWVLPLEESTVIGASTFHWEIDAEGKLLQYNVEPLPIDENQRKLLIQFNQWRFMNGLPAVTIDQELSDACTKHCAYMEKHGLTHEQRKGAEGYTPQGAEAGLRSCIGENGPIESVHMFYSSFYHRLPLIHPGTRSIGVGASQRYAAVDGLTRRDRRPWQYPVIVPAPNSFGHPTHFAPEAPNPRPADVAWAGFPITLTFDTGKITDVKAELRLKGPKGKEVPIAVSWPGHPANAKRPDNRNSICILPKVPLGPRLTWWVRVSYQLDGEAQEREWRFNTGRPAPGRIVYLQRTMR